MRKLLLLFLILLPIAVLAQTTTVTGTVTDPDGFAWVGGTVQFQLYNAAGGTVKQGGVPLTPAQMLKVVTLDGTGSFSTGLADNTTLTPVGTQWNLLVCPAASASCQTFPRFTASGASLSLTTFISSQITALRFPAGYASRGYGDVEISPLPPPGGTYFNLQSSFIRFWNGTAWANMGSGGGGGGALPSAPANSIQASNSNQTAFISDANFTLNNATHTVSNMGNEVVNAFSILPRAIFDPMDTQYNGGLAAAIAGTSGFTPTQVIQAAIDAGECAIQSGAVVAASVILPPKAFVVSALLMWQLEAIGGTSLVNAPLMYHTGSVGPMIAGHTSSDVLTCGTHTYTPAAGRVEVSNISISGNPGSGPTDIGIEATGAGWFVHDIAGGPNGFGRQALWDNSTQNFFFRIGYNSAQVKGCQDFINGIVPKANCQVVEMDGVDSEVDYVYDTDGGAFLTGHGPGACYPDCAGVGLNGGNVRAFRLFPQLTGIGVIMNGLNNHLTMLRDDANSMEGIRINNTQSGSVLNDIAIMAPCLSSSLSSNYAAGIATGCYGIFDQGSANVISNAQIGSQSFFGSSYINCLIVNAQVGASGVPNWYTNLLYVGNPDNQTPNDLGVCGGGQFPRTSVRTDNLVTFPMLSHNAMVNINGLAAIAIDNTTAITQAMNGSVGQTVDITASFSQVTGYVNPTPWDGTSGHLGINTCSGVSETVGVDHPIRLVVGENHLNEICNSPNVTPLYVNIAGNPPMTAASMISFYGNEQAFQIPTFIVDVSQIHGTLLSSGQYCFIERANFADNYPVNSQLACTSVDITNQTPGEVFAYTLPQAYAYDLFLYSKPAGSPVPLGKIAAPALTGPTGAVWDGPTKIAAGGDGSTPPVPGSNYTGMFIAPWGLLLNTYNNTQPACDITTRGRMWLLSGGGVSPDVYEGCIQTGTSTYTWVNLAFGSTGTNGYVALINGPGSIGNSHINELANAGYATFTEGIILNDTSGNAGNAIGTEGPKPPGCGVGVDCLWTDATGHGWNVDNNGNGTQPLVTTTTTANVVGNCAKWITPTQAGDAGAACGSGGGTAPGTPTYVMDSGGGTGPTAVSFSTGSTDYSGQFNFTTGTCSGGVCPAPAIGVFTIVFSRSYTPQLKCSIEPANQSAVGLSPTVQIYTNFANWNTAHFVAVSNATGLPQSTAFSYYYHCDYQ